RQAQGKSELHATCQLPGIFRKGRIEQRRICSRDVHQLNELVERVISAIRIVWRPEHNLADNYRADERADVGGAKRSRPLRDEVFLPHAGDVPAKGNAVIRGAKTKAVEPAGELARCIGAEEPYLVAIRAEREAGAAWIDVGLIKNPVAAGRKNHVVGDAKFFWRA